MTIYAFDWSGTRGVIYVCSDDLAPNPNETPVKTAATLTEMVSRVTEPSMFVGEATFESFDLAKREEFLQAIKDGGHELKTVPNRLTPRFRRAVAENDKAVKTDASDAIAILVEALLPYTHLSTYHPADAEYIEHRDAVMKVLMLVRQGVSAGDRARPFIARLPAVKDIPLDLVDALTSGRKYRKYRPTFVACVGTVAPLSKNRKDFERLMGLYAHGYPGQGRSDFYYWTYQFSAKAGVTLSQQRKAARWLYHHLKESC